MNTEFGKDYVDMLKLVASDYEAISSELFAIAHTIEDTPRHNPHNKIYSLIRTAETNTVTLRNLGARTQWSNIAPFYEDLATVLGISVKEYEKWITITVPAILPNRNRRDISPAQAVRFSLPENTLNNTGSGLRVSRERSMRGSLRRQN